MWRSSRTLLQCKHFHRCKLKFLFVLTVNALLGLHQATSRQLFIVFGLIGSHNLCCCLCLSRVNQSTRLLLGWPLDIFVFVLDSLVYGVSCLQVIVSFISFQVMSCFLLQFDTCLFWAWPGWLLACRLCYSCPAVIQSFTVLPPLIWMNEWNKLTDLKPTMTVSQQLVLRILIFMLLMLKRIHGH